MMKASWIRPKTLDEAVSILEAGAGEALVYAGGTYVHEQRERGLLSHVKAVVDLQGLGLGAVEEANGSLKLGAMLTLNGLIADSVFRGPGFKVLVQAAYAMGPDQIKNAATLGGAVACGASIIDIVPALMVLRARAVLRDRSGSGTVEVGELLSRSGKSPLGRSALITGFLLPHPDAGSRSQFKKHRRSASDWAVVNASASIRLEGDGRCAEARLAVGARPDGYFSLTRTEQWLIGKRLNPEVLAGVPASAGLELVLTDHFTASADYKRHLSGILIRDAVAGAAGIRLHPGGAPGGADAYG